MIVFVRRVYSLIFISSKLEEAYPETLEALGSVAEGER